MTCPNFLDAGLIHGNRVGVFLQNLHKINFIFLAKWTSFGKINCERKLTASSYDELRINGSKPIALNVNAEFPRSYAVDEYRGDALKSLVGLDLRTGRLGLNGDACEHSCAKIFDDFLRNLQLCNACIQRIAHILRIDGKLTLPIILALIKVGLFFKLIFGSKYWELRLFTHFCRIHELKILGNAIGEQNDSRGIHIELVGIFEHQFCKI